MTAQFLEEILTLTLSPSPFNPQPLMGTSSPVTYYFLAFKTAKDLKKDTALPILESTILDTV